MMSLQAYLRIDISQHISTTVVAYLGTEHRTIKTRWQHLLCVHRRVKALILAVYRRGHEFNTTKKNKSFVRLRSEFSTSFELIPRHTLQSSFYI